MTSKTKRAIVAFGLAPVAPSLLYWAYYFLGSGPAIHDAQDLWTSLAAIFWTSLVVTLPITLAVGVPAYVLIETNSTLRRAHVLGVSGVVGGVVGLLAGAPVPGAVLGLSAGITFWLIWHRERDEPPF